MNDLHKGILQSLLLVVATAALLSVLFGVPYIITIIGLSVWVAFGHFVTIDDDAPKGWSNPEGSKKIWHSSLIGLSLKFGVLILLFVLVYHFPVLKEYGA